MSVVVVYNPKSGRGRGLSVAALLVDHLRGRGMGVVSASIREQWRDLLNGARAVIAAGGDGTVHAVASAVLDTGVPVYQCPMGTENLFAREFGMSREPVEIGDAIERGRTRRVDVGMCNGRAFVIMCSVGCDANVIHRLDRVRNGAISHSSYAMPTLREVMRPAIPKLCVTVDGRVVVDGGRGQLVVANSRQYAMRIDPARDARVDDGALDLVFLPHGTVAGAVAHGARARMRLKDGRGVVRARGASIRVESVGGEAVYQFDGEASGRPAGSVDGTLAAGLAAHERLPMEMSVRAGALTVLEGL
ncbi:MAG: NAD(+)/NADH kinase [Phycisphaerales bacterium]|nr:NAD(+)/NADH kinase [Phycisphaerales bacterium]